MILLTQEQYPQPISIEFLSDKIDLLNTISEGEQVKIGINIRGREWQLRMDKSVTSTLLQDGE
jgi:hypothetical protein